VHDQAHALLEVVGLQRVEDGHQEGLGDGGIWHVGQVLKDIPVSLDRRHECLHRELWCLGQLDRPDLVAVEDLEGGDEIELQENAYLLATRDDPSDEVHVAALALGEIELAVQGELGHDVTFAAEELLQVTGKHLLGIGSRLL
jgi:hypothetical protein